MKAYEIVNGMMDTLDIFLESDQTDQDKENYNYIMEFLKEELETKSSNTVKYIRNMELEVKLLKSEEERLEILRKSREKKIDNLKGYMVNILRKLDRTKIETDLGSLGLRKSYAVAIDNEAIIPKKYLEKKFTINKSEIGAILKSGKKVKGTHLAENYSLQIR